MAGNGRVIPDNCLHSLMDAQATILDAWDALTAAQQRVESARPLDPALVVKLSELTRALAGIEHHVAQARHNQYIERRSAS